MALPKLVVELAAKIREYMADMDKAAKSTEDSAARIEKAEKDAADATQESGKRVKKTKQELTDAAKDLATGQADVADTAVQVASRMGPMGGAVAAAAAVVAGAAAVSYKAAQENTALVRAMALSGNQAGVTAGQLQGLAAAASQVVGTHTQAAQAIGQMVSGGQVAGENLQALAVTALTAQRTLGLSVQDTVKHYDELGEAPTKASRKLNEAMGYLNAETYRRIQALEEMGRKDEAAALAQLSYAKGLDDATKKVEASLGTLQRAWRSVGEAASKAWDWMLGLGRKDEVQDSLGALRKELEAKERQLRAGFATTGGGAAVGMRGMSDDRRGQLEAEAETLREQIRLLGRAGATAAQNAAASVKYQNESIEWAAKAAAAEERLKTNATKRADAIAEADRRLAMGYITQAERNTLVADAEQRYADKVAKGNDGQRERNALLRAQQRELNELFKQILAQEKAEHDAGVAAQKNYDQVLDRQDKAAASAEKELERQLALNAAMGLTKEAVAELEAAKLEETATTKERLAALADEIDWSGRMGDAYRDEAAALYALAKAKRDGASKQAGLDADKAAQKGADELAKEGLRAAQKIEDALTDSLMRGFESGKGFLRNLRDTAVNMFKTLMLRPTISAVVNPVAGAITGSLGLAGATNAGQGGNLLGTASNLSSAYDALSNGVSNAVSAGFDKLVTNGVGEKLGLSYYNGTGYETTGIGQSVGQYAGMAGNALAGYGLQKTISGGYKTGESGLVDAITVAASAYFGPIAGVAAGVFNRAFGRKLADQGIQGQFGGEAGFTGENYTFEKGGWFRSDKTKTSALDAGMQSGLANQFKALQVQTALMATVLGDTGQSVADFTSSIKLSFNGLTEAQIGEKLSETFAGIANDLAKTVLGDSAFAKEGEAASQTLQRLANSLTTVNGTFDVLGFSLEAVNLAGANAASGFVDLMGGLDAFKATTAGYYANFYSETERQAKATEQLTAQLAGLGQAMPATRDGFRALVNAAEAAGNDALLVGLLNLQDEFAAVVPAAEAAATAVDDTAEALKSAAKAAASAAYDGLQRAVDAQRTVYQAQIEAAQEAAGSMRGLFDLLAGNIRDLYAEAAGPSLTAYFGNKIIDDALGAARTTGYMPEQGTLSDAISAARSGLGIEQYASVAEQQFAQKELANRLLELQGLTGEQLTAAELAQRTAESQLEALDQTLKYWKEQLDLSQGNITATLSVADAITALQEALKPGSTPAGKAAAAAKAGSDPNGFSTGAGGPGSAGPNPTGSRYENAVPYYEGVGAISDYYNSMSGWNDPAQQLDNIMALYNQAQALDVSANQVAAGIGIPADDIQQVLADLGLPPLREFANGGYHSGGWAIVGEQGPELAYMPPAHIYTAPQTSALLNGAATAQVDTRRMEQLLADMAARLAAIEATSRQHAAQFDQVTEGGNAIRSMAIA